MKKKEILVLEDLLGSNKKIASDIREKLSQKGILTINLMSSPGAGKTTLVKMLAGIIHPSAGSARVLGYEPCRRDNRYRRQIALIMGQKAQLWWDLPAADCFLLLKEIYQLADGVFQERLAGLSEVLGVEEQVNIQIRRLSLGERIASELGRKSLEQVYVKGGNGYVVLTSIGKEAVLTALARSSAKLGLVFLEMRRATEDLEKLF